MASGLQYIALAKKAGILELGEDAAKALVKSGKARLMFVCADTSPGAKRRAEGFVYGCGVPLIEVPYLKEDVSAATGRPGCSMAAFRDIGLAASFASALLAEHGERYREIAETLETKRAGMSARAKRSAGAGQSERSGNRRKRV